MTEPSAATLVQQELALECAGYQNFIQRVSEALAEEHRMKVFCELQRNQTQAQMNALLGQQITPPAWLMPHGYERSYLGGLGGASGLLDALGVFRQPIR